MTTISVLSSSALLMDPLLLVQTLCFLAEIVDVEKFLRFRLVVEDRAGLITRLMFYIDNRGEEVSPSLLRQGYTIAILYAEQHGFLNTSVGIRHEESKFLKVKPTSAKPAVPPTPRLDASGRVEGTTRAQRSRQEACRYRPGGNHIPYL
jgi:hypothetical protein